ncbi:phage terminase large subunit family protein [Dyella sp. M7H15-1]|uniref:phage terminase large subunit family protein n=1 Tax=Dyella sp. M7H15-1 TaxID=2501295 RepID=UPI001004DF90|nr:phage terminase large subunit family protein [Dyella sp. M7H15-1]QAU22881.1 phage terminase large subunit family protein [Dyella sp. M7H15-1]
MSLTPTSDAERFRNTAGVRYALHSALQQLRPPPKFAPSEWAEKHVYVPEGNKIPGLLRLDNAPYQREPMDMLVNPDCYRVTLEWGAQVGKTMLALCVQGYCIDVMPRSQMMMQPSQGDLQMWLETKFTPLVEANDRLQRLIAKPRGREGVNNQKMKSYPGGFIMFSWAGSPRTMRGRSAPVIVCDEVDGYERTSEGGPVSLLWQRAATFDDDRFLLEISTPTIEGQSYIDKSFQAGDQRRFHVPCHACGTEQVLRWENVSWVGRGETHEDTLMAIDDQQPETALYVCECCGVTWNDGQRIAAIRAGRWMATKPFRGHASYHLSEFYSTFRRLSSIVLDYLDRLKNDDLQTFVNVTQAEVWTESGEQVDANAIEQRAETYAAEVPAGGVYLTLGGDMQIDRLEAEVVAHGPGEESWSIGYYVLWGDPLQREVWDELDDLLATTFTHESGATLRIESACIDTGGTKGYTQAAYDYLRGKTGRRLFGVKGVGGWNRPIVEKSERKQSGKNARKVDLFRVGVDEAKKIIMRRLTIDAPGPGYMHTPVGRSRDWYDQLTAEKLVTRYVKGQPVREWRKSDKARNEALDCRVYAYAALKIAQPNLAKRAERLAMLTPGTPPPRQRAAPQPEIPPEAAQDTAQNNAGKTRPARTRSAKRRAGTWATNW